MVAERAGASELRVCAGEGRLRADIVAHFPDIVYLYSLEDEESGWGGEKGSGECAVWRETEQKPSQLGGRP